jgi:soluble lytic murein transglycosylase-like protein
VRLLCILFAVAAFAQTRESIEKQLQSVEQQRVAVAKMWPEPELAVAVCDPAPEDQIAPLIDSAVRAQALPANLIRAVIEQESGLRPCAVSKAGAKGLMQLMPETAGQFNVDDPFDPQANIAAGSRYLRQLLDKYKGDLTRALGAYNAGPETVDKAGGVPDIPETRGYVDAILGKLGTKHIDLPPLPPDRPPEAAKPIEPPKPIVPPQARE